MSTKRRPLAALAGVAYCLLAIAGTLAYPSSPGFVAAPEEVASFYLDNSGALLGASTIYMLAGVLLIVFTGYLRSALGRAEGGDHAVASIAFAGGVAGAALSIGAASMDLVGALRVEDRDTIAPDAASTLADVGGALYGVAAPMALAVLVLATALIARRTGVLPLWHVAISAILGIALLAPPINYIAVIVFTFWALITGTVLYLAGGASADPHPATSA